MTTAFWLMLLVSLGMAFLNLGYFLGEKNTRRTKNALEEQWALRLAKEEESSKLFREMTLDLNKQLIRIQRATVQLPEVAPPDPKQEEPPPEELVRICSAFGEEGVRILTQARRQRRAGIDWSFIIQGLRRQIEQQSPDALRIIEGG